MCGPVPDVTTHWVLLGRLSLGKLGDIAIRGTQGRHLNLPLRFKILKTHSPEVTSCAIPSRFHSYGDNLDMGAGQWLGEELEGRECLGRVA